jgi:hypothetical protein
MAALALSWLALAFVAAAAPEPSLRGRQPPARSAPPPSVQTTLVVTWEMDDPNGQPRKVIKTNGRFPGPTLVLDEDDEVEVRLPRPPLPPALTRPEAPRSPSVTTCPSIPPCTGTAWRELLLLPRCPRPWVDQRSG